MTDDSPWQDLKDAKAGINQAGSGIKAAAKGIDDFASHSTSRTIGPLATKALEASKRAFNKFFSHDEAKPFQRQVQKQVTPAPGQTWSFSGMFLKMIGLAPDGQPSSDVSAPEVEAPSAPEVSADPPEFFDV